MLGTATAALFVASLLAQAEPAPAEPPPPPTAAARLPEAPPLLPSALAIHGRFAYRPGDAVGPAPATGFSLGATFEHRYAMLADVVGLGVGVDFFYDRFSHDGSFESASPELLTQTSFVLLQTFSVQLGRARPVRPWVGAGGGATFAYYSGAGIGNPGVIGPGASTNEVQPLVRAAAGIEVAVAAQTAVVVRADYTHPLTNPTIGGLGSSPFGDLVDAGVGFLVRF